MTSTQILIIGGSTRAAADSVRRAGWLPICADMFADLDLRKNAQVIPVCQYPNSLIDDVKDVRADGWFYCGALENHPEIVAKMQATRAWHGPLIGTPAAVLKRVRDPDWLAQTLRSADLPALPIANESSPPRPDGAWVQKPLAGAGGRLIRIWDEMAARHPLGEPHYFQRRAQGIRLSAIFRVDEATITWLGASRELDTTSPFRAPTAFSYCGSIGPLKRLPLAARTQAQNRFRLRTLVWSASPFEHSKGTVVGRTRVIGCAVFQDVIQRKLTRMARALVQQAPGLRGLVGLDFRLDREDVWLTEVNPRYTASVELLELATGQSLLNPDGQRVDFQERSNREGRPRVIGKQVLYATNRLMIPDLSRFLPDSDPWEIPSVADIPIPDSIVEPGWPICTVMASGANAKVVEETLSHRAFEVQAAIIQRGN